MVPFESGATLVFVITAIQLEPLYATASFFS
jgi:hypothetical protein